MTETIRIFVGCAANGEDAESQAVLEYTLRRHASLPLDIVWMRLDRDPDSPFFGPAWATEMWATPFSGFRWAVPSLCNFRGVAIYMDSDVIVQGDIAALWRQPFPPEALVLARGAHRLCVSVWDCGAIGRHGLARKFDLETVRRTPGYHRAMGTTLKTFELVAPFSGDWNNLDGEGLDDLSQASAIHYTSMAHQPHLRHALPRLEAAGQRHWYDGDIVPHWRADLQALFDRLLAEAEAAGFRAADYVPAEPFGPYRKKSLAGRSPAVPHWGRRARTA